MKKTKLIIESLVLFSVLILIPIAICYDFNGDGIDDGPQNLCGDNFCQSWENISSCPADCINPQNDVSPSHISSNEENSPKNSFFSDIVFKIIIIVLILIIIGVIIYILSKKKASNLNQQVYP